MTSAERSVSFKFLFPALLALAGAVGAAQDAQPKTIIKGARMEVLKKGEMTEFRDGVTLTRGYDFMSADRMVNHERTGVTQAWGRVYLRRRDPARGILWEAWSDRAVYDSNEAAGTLWGRVFMEVNESTPTVRRTRVWADRAERDPAKGSLRFTGVYPARGPRAGLMPPWPDAAKPRPRVVQREPDQARDLAGNVVTYFEEDGRVIAEGDVRTAWRKGDGDAPQR